MMDDESYEEEMSPLHGGSSDFSHKQKILNAILKRINRQKNQVNQAIGVQSDLESLSNEDEE